MPICYSFHLCLSVIHISWFQGQETFYACISLYARTRPERAMDLWHCKQNVVFTLGFACSEKGCTRPRLCRLILKQIGVCWCLTTVSMQLTEYPLTTILVAAHSLLLCPRFTTSFLWDKTHLASLSSLFPSCRDVFVPSSILFPVPENSLPLSICGGFSFFAFKSPSNEYAFAEPFPDQNIIALAISKSSLASVTLRVSTRRKQKKAPHLNLFQKCCTTFIKRGYKIEIKQ